MPRIEISRTVRAPLEKVVAIARNVERYPEIMPDVKEIAVLEKSEDERRQVTRWVGTISQFKMTVKWTQEETWNDDFTRVDFRQLEGDYDKMEGYWQFEPMDSATEFTSVLEYEYRVPLLGPLVAKVIHHLAEQNVRSAMDAIAKEAES